MAKVQLDFGEVGGGGHYKKGSIAVPSGGVTVNCGFEPKKVFGTVLTIYNGTTYVGAQVYDEDSGINGYAYKNEVMVKDFTEHYLATEATITPTANGFTIVPINNTAWAGATVYYYAAD